MDASLFSGAIGFILLSFLMSLVVLWTCLPFAIFGTKALLNELIAETRTAREVNERVLALLEAERQDREIASSAPR